MIQTIGIMIGFYIITRCLELIGTKNDTWFHVFASLGAVITIIITVIGVTTLVLSSVPA